MNNYIDINSRPTEYKNLTFFASEQVESEIKLPSEYLLELDYIKDAIVLGLGNEVVVSVLTSPIYMASVRNALTESIVKIVKEKTNSEEVYVNYDTDIYYKASRAMQEKDLKDILIMIKTRK